MSSNYEVKMECNNCNFSGNVEIPKGTKASDFKSCPVCECDTLQKCLFNQSLTERYTKPSPYQDPHIRPCKYSKITDYDFLLSNGSVVTYNVLSR